IQSLGAQYRDGVPRKQRRQINSRVSRYNLAVVLELRKPRRLAIAAFLLLLPGLTADEFSYRTWRTEDGLPGNRIRALEETRDGYLWVGTPSGLARFDGARFTVFDSSNTPELLDESITVLWPSRDGGGYCRQRLGGDRPRRVSIPQQSIYQTRLRRLRIPFRVGGGYCGGT